MSIHIRAFETSDYSQARALWEATPGVGLSDADTPRAIEAFLSRNPGASFVATQGGALVGTILCGHDGRRGLIHHLVTVQSHRRQGAGRALLCAGVASTSATFLYSALTPTAWRFGTPYRRRNARSWHCSR